MLRQQRADGVIWGTILIAAATLLVLLKADLHPLWVLLLPVLVGIIAFVIVASIAKFFANQPSDTTAVDFSFRRICTNCGSSNVSSYSPPGYLMGRVLYDRCMECGNGDPQGRFWTRLRTFPEMNDVAAKKYRASLRKKKKAKNDTTIRH